MKIKKYDIQIPYERIGIKNALSVRLTTYITEISSQIGRKNKPAVIICPGGGYANLSDRESEPVALRFAAMGVQAFVLEYSVNQKPFPMALLELAQTTAFVRANAVSWDIDPDNICVCGFSAGGHLAASLGVHWNKGFVKDTLEFTDEHKPNSLILCYPVITAGEYAHKGSVRNITGLNPASQLTDLVSLEKHVDADTPRTFIWHCADDDVVPVENTILFISALSRSNISFQCTVYPFGGHGLALCDETTSCIPSQYNKKCSGWFNDAVEWLKHPDK
ncbi:MAG: alpha/beta hydrolase [Oscillospiraceae bacterium]|nr:alpha/beta hydrolase [Oscillospiraceae bacterium]